MLNKIKSHFSGWKPEHKAMAAHFPSNEEIKSQLVADHCKEHVVVAFYTTDPIYTNEARRMLASAQRLELKTDITPVKRAGEWVRNASMKAAFLSRQRTIHSGPMLYVDVDAVFHRNPWPQLTQLKADIAVYYEKSGRLLAGTIFIADTAAAQNLLDEWAKRCNASPDIWDQVILEEILAEDTLKTNPIYQIAILPVSFCWIFDKSDNSNTSEVFIEHLQASRESCNKKSFFRPMKSRLKRRRDRTLEIENILFSTSD